MVHECCVRRPDGRAMGTWTTRHGFGMGRSLPLDATTSERVVLARGRGGLDAGRLTRGRGDLGTGRPHPWARRPRCRPSLPVGEVTSAQTVLARGRDGLGVGLPPPWARWPRHGPYSHVGKVALVRVILARGQGDLGTGRPRPCWPRPRCGSSSPVGEVTRVRKSQTEGAKSKSKRPEM
ncbi:hypothetical protein Bca101_020110 [Brassica carinata]